MSVEPPSEWHTRQAAWLAFRGLDPSLTFDDAEPAPSNVSDIRAARTQRAAALILRRRGTL
jgi:hypothetical protein